MSFFARLKVAAAPEWTAYTEHPFTTAMADGTLREPAFRHYLVQDYLFLIEFARAYALSVYKAPTLADMREGAAGIAAILDVEMDLHIKLCAGGGLSWNRLRPPPPWPAGRRAEALSWLGLGVAAAARPTRRRAPAASRALAAAARVAPVVTTSSTMR